jgi:putative membrane protein
MMIAIPYLHYIGIMVLMGSLIAEHLLLKPKMNKEQISTLAGIDLIYGLSALLVLATGLLRWFVYGKGTAYYLSNHFFHAKLTLFVILGALSIIPTIKFLKWRKQVNNGQEPDLNDRIAKKLLMIIRLELLILVIIPLLAVMIFMGVGAK